MAREFSKPFDSAARSAGSNQVSDVFDVGGFTSASLHVDLTAIGGAPSTTALDVKLQYSPDTSGTRWFDLPSGAITQLTAVGQGRVNSVALGIARRLRVSYTLAFTGGTAPTGTFAVDLALIT